MRTVAILPIKRFARAKQRLRDALDDEPRTRLAEAMAGDVLEVLCGFDAFAPAFGPGSRARHEAAADAARLDRAAIRLPALTLDVDTPDDLAALRASGRLGSRTAAALEALALV